MARSKFSPQTFLWIYFCILEIMADNCPQPCTCTGAHNLAVNCSGLRLPALPALSTSTLTLDLSSNSLGPIINTSFVQMRNLTSVDLSANGLTRLLGCTFSGMLELATLRIRSNSLTTLPDSIFSDTNKLQYLDISFNRLTAIPDLIFQNTPELKFLDVSHNSIGQFHLGAGFQVPRSIQHLDISHNPIETIPSNASVSAAGWRNVTARSMVLAYCRLSSVEDGAFANIPNLHQLDLTGNGALVLARLRALVKSVENKGLKRLSIAFMNLETIDSLFNETTQLALEFLNASFNSITDLPANTFSNVRSLQVLDLRGNAISTLAGGVSDLVNLQVLNVSGNRLDNFNRESVTHLTNLHTVDVSDNMLSDSARADFSSFAHLRYLNVRNNSLTLAVLPRRTPHLQYLDYSYNRIHEFQGLEDATMLEMADFSNNQLHFLPGLLFKGARFLKLVNFSSNRITALDHGAFLPQSSIVIDLSYNFLTELRYSNWVATQKLYVQHNNITQINSQAFYGMTGLEELDLSYNKLTHLHEDLLQYLTNLRYLNVSHNWLDNIDWFALFRSLELVTTLDLGYNNIAHINESFFLPIPKIETVSIRNNRLRYIIPDTFKELNEIKYLDLSNNPFDCSCDGLDFRDWLKGTKLPILGLYEVNSSAYHCHTPPGRAGIHVINWSTQQFECDQSILYIIAFCSTFILLTLLGLMGAGLYRLYTNWRLQNAKVKRTTELEEERNQRTKKVDFVRLSNSKLTDERSGSNIKREYVDRPNGYVLWPGGAQKQQWRERSRSYNTKDADKERILPDDKTEGEERQRSEGRHYEKLKRREWAAEDAERQRRRDRDERPHKHTVASLDSKSGDRPRGQRARESSSQQRYFHTRVPSHPDDLARDELLAIDRERYFYDDPRFREGPYIISSASTFPDRWESPHPWEEHENRSSSYYLKPRGEGQPNDAYTSMPQMNRDAIRHGRAIRPRDRASSHTIPYQPLEVHFDADSEPTRVWSSRRGAPRHTRYPQQRSRSYHYLPEDYLSDVPFAREELGQWQYESVEPPSRHVDTGHRAVSQPYLGQDDASLWL